MTACRRVLGFLDGFGVVFGWGGKSCKPIFLGLAGTGFSDMVKTGKVFRILPQELQRNQLRTWYIGLGTKSTELQLYISNFLHVIPVPVIAGAYKSN